MLLYKEKLYSSKYVFLSLFNVEYKFGGSEHPALTVEPLLPTYFSQARIMCSASINLNMFLTSTMSDCQLRLSGSLLELSIYKNKGFNLN